MGLDDLTKLRDYLKREGRVITRAPAAFATCLLTFAIIIALVEWNAIDSQYVRRLADMGSANTRLDATIKSLQATIQFQETRIADLSGKQPKSERASGVSRIQ